jgi:hypothetical protein
MPNIGQQYSLSLSAMPTKHSKSASPYRLSLYLATSRNSAANTTTSAAGRPVLWPATTTFTRIKKGAELHHSIKII